NRWNFGYLSRGGCELQVFPTMEPTTAAGRICQQGLLMIFSSKKGENRNPRLSAFHKPLQGDSPTSPCRLP
ncbi:MAG TPA: hypothetical protein VEM32_00790, partial [Geobacteraceae bacterium]|nr:hypothetical protein [Geobacteraceae bacterium]